MDGEAAATEEEHVPPLRRSRRRRIALALALLLVAALAVLWHARRTIATRYVDGRLAASGVPARYTVADLAPGRQRLTNVVIGDPADPDLVADWVETRVRYGLSGAALEGVAAGHVRLRARLVGGRVSLGALDRLLPPPSGKPFALPALHVDVADARIRLETAAGVVGLKVAGAGKLDDGFAGTVAAVAPRLSAGGCSVEGASAAMRVRIAKARPTLTGPLRASAVRCDGVAVADARSDLHVTLAAALDRWQGRARLATGPVRTRAAGAASAAGTIDFAGSARSTAGALDVTGSEVRAVPGRAARVALAGRYRIGAGAAFDGRARVAGAAVAPAVLARWTGWDAAAAGTPAAPLARALAAAVRRAGADFDGDAVLATSAGQVEVSRLSLAAASGARVALSGVEAGPAGVRLDGGLAMSGGGLPTARVSLAQAAPGAPVRGLARVAPYAADGASLALTPVSFAATPGGATRIATTATLSGPLGDGRVEALAVPLELGWNGRDRWVVNPRCTPVAWQRLAVGGLTLDRSRLALCPVGPALVRVAGGRVAGGARLGASRLTGRLGSTPLTLATGAASLRLGDRGFAVADVAARLGAPGRESRLEIASLTGRLGQGVAGRFAGGAGRIGAVPLQLSGAAGEWRLADGALDLSGMLTVSDTAASPRFRPMAARGVTLRLKDGRVAAAGTLAEPTTGTRVAEVRIAHLLGPGTGTATLAVPGMTFGEGFQPELLTPLTFGVVADVRGTVSGDARIAWGPDGVTSTGTFGTKAVDLAAAFGPVTGIATTLTFTDLLGMRTAPGQVATVATVNPGIQVEDGVVRYALEGPTLVRVEGARWPFAGGDLTLDPTLLDFSRERQRRMTFRVDGADARAFLQQFDFDNLDATGTFDGVLPMVFDETGGRIDDGRLRVREGGGTIAYVGTLTQKQLGTWGDFAFQALKSLRYRSLAVTLNGPLAGEMVTDVRFAGVAQGAGAKSNFLIRRLQRLPLVFNIRIRAPFRGLLDSARSFYDPRRLIQRNLPALIEQQNRAAAPPIQPPASEKVR